MKIRHTDLIIEKENPFKNCRLDRAIHADVLTSIVGAYSEGFVLAINNEWGTGKTTFLKMWKQHLENNNFKTIYFNAWENDFDQNPLVAIISELKSLSNNSTEEIFKSILKNGAVLSKNILPELLKELCKKFLFDSEAIADTIKNIVKGVTDILGNEIEEYVEKKKTIQDFRKDLEEFAQKVDNDKPIVFIIDELDRCRPNYAVELLEQIKHFFSVQGIVFVLSIDKTQLSHAVKGVYGSEEINSEEYLRRFIDLEYSLPAPSTNQFCNYLYEYYGFDEIFSKREELRGFEDEKGGFLKISQELFSQHRVTLRQQEKIYGLTRLVLSIFDQRSYIIPEILFVLILLKVLKSEIYTQIRKSSFSLEELSFHFCDLAPKSIDRYSSTNWLYLDYMLLNLYNNDKGYDVKEQLIARDENNKETLLVKSKLKIDVEDDQHIRYIIHLKIYFDFGLSHLLNKIDMMERLKVVDS